MATAYELAQKYYPRLWDKPCLEALAEAGRLTQEEVDEITGIGGEPAQPNDQGTRDTKE